MSLFPLTNYSFPSMITKPSLSYFLGMLNWIICYFCCFPLGALVGSMRLKIQLTQPSWSWNCGWVFLKLCGYPSMSLLYQQNWIEKYLKRRRRRRWKICLQCMKAEFYALFVAFTESYPFCDHQLLNLPIFVNTAI